jgi:hypothetical protein
MFLAVINIRSRTDNPNTFPIGHEVNSCFGRVLKKGLKKEDTQNVLG